MDARITQILTEAGWYPNRTVGMPSTMPSDFTLFPRAAEILREFGGLRVGVSGRGIERATCSIFFNTIFAEGMSEEIGLSTDIPIYPIGEIDEGQGYLFIDIEDRIYMLTDELELLGSSFESTLKSLLLGTAP